MVNILFLCKYNRFRSRYAEAYFRKFYKDIKVRSAGIIRGSYPLDSNQVSIAKERGINLKGRPRGISTDLLKWLDILIIAADDVPSELFNNYIYCKKLIVWDIPDVKSGSKEEIKRIMINIEENINIFIEELKNGKKRI